MVGLLEHNVSSLRRRDDICYFYHSAGSDQIRHPSIPRQHSSECCYPSKKRSHFSLNSHNSPNRDVNHSGMSGTRIETFLAFCENHFSLFSSASKRAGRLPGFNLHQCSYVKNTVCKYRRSVMTPGAIP